MKSGLKNLMKYKFNIRLKISLFIIAFTTVLIISLLSFVYISEKKSILKESTEKLYTYHNLIKLGIEKELFGTISELNILKNQFSDNRLFIPQFISNYIDKYKDIRIFEINQLHEYHIYPTVVFGGEIKIIIDTLKIDSIPNNYYSTQKFKILEFKIEKGEKSIDIVLMPTDSNPFLLKASISLEYLISSTIKLYKLPSSINTILSDKNGNILYSPINKDINQNFKNCYGFDKDELYNKIDKIQIVNNTLYLFGQIKAPDLIIILYKNILADLYQNKLLIKRMIYFVLFLLLIVLLIVGIISKQLTSSLDNITSVAGKISEGDFSDKISLHRNDEIGTLIDAFNQMVDKLNSTFTQLDSSNKQLKENIEELVRTREKLSQNEKLALIGETVSKISHDIQNKIGGISIWIQNLELYENSDETIKLYVNEMKDALCSFMEMLTDFKKFYRESALNLEKVNIQKLILRSIGCFKNEIQTKKINLKISLGHNIFLLIDRIKIDEVISNLIINAIYYAPKNSNMDIIGKEIDNYYNLTIIDDGRGISQDEQDKLFQPFYSTKPNGSGLGLAICLSIIKSHKGEISIKNIKNRGACVNIKLPLH